MANINASPIGIYRGKFVELTTTRNADYCFAKIAFHYSVDVTNLTDRILLKSADAHLVSQCKPGSVYDFSMSAYVSQADIQKSRPLANINYNILSVTAVA